MVAAIWSSTRSARRREAYDAPPDASTRSPTGSRPSRSRRWKPARPSASSLPPTTVTAPAAPSSASITRSATSTHGPRPLVRAEQPRIERRARCRTGSGVRSPWRAGAVLEQGRSRAGQRLRLVDRGGRRRCHGRFWLTSSPKGRDVVVIAHRVAYAFAYGDEALAAAQLLTHSCDNTLCQNVEHLRPGTELSNAWEWVERRHRVEGPPRDVRGAAGRARAARAAILAGQTLVDILRAGDPDVDQQRLFQAPRRRVIPWNHPHR